MVRETRRPASERLEINDPLVALDLDLAIAERMFRHDNEVQKRFAKRIAIAVGMAFEGKLNELDDDNW